MGRKPHVVVTEFFIRGAKLNDASNRYTHTCKRCGEVFPKGRLDTLFSHVLRRCPHVNDDDKAHAFQAIQQQHPEPRPVAGDLEGQPFSAQPFVTSQTQYQFPLSAPSHREPSALDTLAEVSRRHLDYSSQHPETALPYEPPDGAIDEHAARALAEQLQNAINSSDHSMTLEPDDAHVQAPSSPTKVGVGLDGMPATSVASAATHAIASSPLVQTAFAANEQLEQSSSQKQTQSVIDPGLQTVDAQLQHELAPNTTGSDAAPLSQPATTTSIQDFMDLSVTSQPRGTVAGHGLWQRSTKYKARSRFTDVRRREVQEIRKQGACLRCRMLKKSCSEDTPCKTCSNVESARLWKGACIRTRLEDEFSLWSTGLFHSKAKIDVPAAVYGLQHMPMEGCIEARFFGESELCMSFAVRKYGIAISESTLVGSHRSEVGDTGETPGLEEIWLLDEGEGISNKIEKYSNRVADACIAVETSVFLRRTLERARDIARADGAVGTLRERENSTVSRSCHNNQNQLLQNVVELWIETQILAFRKQENLTLGYSALEQSTESPRQATEHFETPLKRSQQLIYAQLLAATESRCLGLSKLVISELERRLLQRQQVSRFATFLSAIILLSCVERMTAAYRAFDSSPSAGTFDSEPTTAINEPSTLYPPDWPLDDSPSHLWRQGERFASLLNMLLRMRALPPKTQVTADGRLQIDQVQALPVNLMGRPVKEQSDDQTSSSAEWLDHIGLHVDELVQIRDKPVPGPQADGKAWDMRFIAPLLLPERFS